MVINNNREVKYMMQKRWLALSAMKNTQSGIVVAINGGEEHYTYSPFSNTAFISTKAFYKCASDWAENAKLTSNGDGDWDG